MFIFISFVFWKYLALWVGKLPRAEKLWELKSQGIAVEKAGKPSVERMYRL